MCICVNISTYRSLYLFIILDLECIYVSAVLDEARRVLKPWIGHMRWEIWSAKRGASHYRILVSAETCGAMPSECLDRGTIRIPTSVTVAGSRTRACSFGRPAGWRRIWEAGCWRGCPSSCLVCVILYFYPATCGPKGHHSLEQRQ